MNVRIGRPLLRLLQIPTLRTFAFLLIPMRLRPVREHYRQRHRALGHGHVGSVRASEHQSGRSIVHRDVSFQPRPGHSVRQRRRLRQDDLRFQRRR